MNETTNTKEKLEFLSVKYASLLVFEQVDEQSLWLWHTRQLTTVELIERAELKLHLDYGDPFEVAETLNQIARSYMMFHVDASLTELGAYEQNT